MPTISVEQSLIASLLAKHNLVNDIEVLSNELPLLGTDIDNCTNEVLDIEIFPNRPDLLSGETLCRAIRTFIHEQKAEPNLNVKHGNVSITVDKELENIRPVVLGCIVRGVQLEGDIEIEYFIKSLMDHQEKLHFALGRGRRRASIGVHDLSTLKPPFRVKAVSGDTKFIPLAMTEEMSITQILEKHPKGLDYAHLLEGFEKYPVWIDANDAILSFPPIINGNHTTVNKQTRDFFIDVTGWDHRSCEASLMLIASQLCERGGEIESVEVTSFDGVVKQYPDGSAIQHEVPIELLDGLLGRSLTDEEISKAINRMGGKYISRNDKSTITIEMPRWRFDILHPVDLIEDIAIGHGYEDLGSDVPKAPMTAIPRTDGHLRRRIRDSMQGMGFMQIQSLTLSNDEDQFDFMRFTPVGEVTRITNPITIDHTMLRQYLIPGLMRLLATNQHHNLPQSVYELGTVVRNHKNADRVAFLVAERSGGFAAVRGRVQAFMRDIGASNYDIEKLPDGDGPWLPGRAAKVVINGTHVGCFGEIDPSISEKFDLRVPISGAEFSLTNLADSITDPV
ncbi:MAG: phenylalanine--tRNA ligase subunit beta [Candidatus Poseidoniaceae archaeon]|jgi:phenylalanyl-tRNA synthetase beta chain|nr:phenylalanine--tRNA ligase subunit beta [Candidatus Poseidoniaceae archaeon]